jgi:hypothetical protein
MKSECNVTNVLYRVEVTNVCAWIYIDGCSQWLRIIAAITISVLYRNGFVNVDKRIYSSNANGPAV